MSIQAIRVRAVLSRSNPQIIREFLLAEDITLSQLHRVLQLSLGWTEEEFRFEQEGRQLSDEQTVGACLQPGNTVRYCSERRYEWSMRLEAIGSETVNDHFRAEVVRFRGYNPPQACGDITDLNRVLARWSGSPAVGYYWYDDNKRAVDYAFHPDVVNRRIARICRKNNGRMDLSAELPEHFTPDRSRLFRCEKLLASFSISRLKEIAGQLGITAVSGIRSREELIAVISARQKSREGCRFAVFRLNGEEHRAFLEVLLNPVDFEEESWHLFRKLYEMGCLFPTVQGDLVLTEEFAETYLLLRATEDFREELERYRAVADTIRSGVIFYGILTPGDRRLLLNTWYPDLISEEEEEDCVQDFLQYEKSSYMIEKDSRILFFKDELEGYRVKQLAAFARRFSPYIPDREEAAAAVKEGLQFPPAQAEMLSRELRFAGYPEPRLAAVRKAVYRMIQVGKNIDEIYRYYFQASSRGRRQDATQKIADLLERLQDSVRLAARHGHTKDEITGGGQ